MIKYFSDRKYRRDNYGIIKLLISFLVPLIIWFLPVSFFGIEGLTVVEHRLISIFVLAALLWILEPIPIYSTSVLVIFLQLIFLSNQGLKFFVESNSESFGQLLSYKDIMANFAHPLILLFIGGFFLAIASSKYKLDVNLARIILKPFGSNPKYIMLGLMVATALFSMFMSNTATTAMMLAVLAPVLLLFKSGDKGRIALALAIPFAANIGGIGTPIGTPPNGVAMKYLVESNQVSFAEWMFFAFPFALILLLFTWVLLWKMFPSEEKSVKVSIKEKFSKDWKSIVVYATFALTVLLWLTSEWHGMNSYVAAMLPVAVFSVSKVLDKDDLKKISWDVLWLVAGGFALGMAMDKTGLSKHFVESIPFDSFSPYIIVFGVTGLGLLMSAFMSNTATANLLLPIVAVLGSNVDSLSDLGGGKMLVISTAMATSFAMMFPISTPPNAISYSIGIIETKDMIKVGFIIGVVGLLSIYLLMYILKQVGFF